jgi:hypothetical protein
MGESQIEVQNQGPKWGSQIRVPNRDFKSGSQIGVPNQGPKSGSQNRGLKLVVPKWGSLLSLQRRPKAADATHNGLNRVRKVKKKNPPKIL